MGNAALLLQLIIAGLQHVTELNQLLATAAAEGRDVTDAELAACRAKAVGGLGGLDAAIDEA